MQPTRSFSCPLEPRRRAVTFGIAAILAGATATYRGVFAQPAHLRIGGTGMALAAIRRLGDALIIAQPDLAVTVLPSLGTGGGLARGAVRRNRHRARRA